MPHYQYPSVSALYRDLHHAFPLITRGRGVFIYDTEGRKYLDGSGPALVITDYGVFGFTRDTREMILREIHPGVTVADVKANIGWDVKVSRKLAETAPPTEEELRVIREDLDPDRIYLR
jgi:adenosylmethionine-8-amino-7-oxononanoate aminotransferase